MMMPPKVNPIKRFHSSQNKLECFSTCKLYQASMYLQVMPEQRHHIKK